MIAGDHRLPRHAGIPDLEALLYKPPGCPLNLDDFIKLLRCYMREVLSWVDFLYLCRAGLLARAVEHAMPPGVGLTNGVPHGIGLPLEILRNGQPTPYLDFFLIRIPVAQTRGSEGVSFAVLEYADPAAKTVRFRILTEREFLNAMAEHGFTAPLALRQVHSALHLAATAETPDRVEPLASRIERLGKKMSALFQARGLAW